MSGARIAGTAPAKTLPAFTSSRHALWFSAAGIAALVALPFVFAQGFALSLMCQMGIAAIFALSYNMLLGQTGLLSFGHAVYFGLGAFCAIHAMRWAGGAGVGGA